MSRLPDHAYHFTTGAHWRAGVRDGFRVDGGALRAPGSLRARLVPGSGPADRGALIAVDPCGRLLWVRPVDRSARRWDALGVAGSARSCGARRRSRSRSAAVSSGSRRRPGSSAMTRTTSNG